MGVCVCHLLVVVVQRDISYGDAIVGFFIVFRPIKERFFGRRRESTLQRDVLFFSRISAHIVGFR